MGGASLEARDRLGAMPLAHAARAGQRALVELFLARARRSTRATSAGATALWAATESERQASVALLLAKGADPNLPGRSGVTPLAAAAFKGNDRIVEQLLARCRGPQRGGRHRQGGDDLRGGARISWRSCAACSTPASMPGSATATS